MNIDKVINERDYLANKLNKTNGKILRRILKVFDTYRIYKLQSIKDNYPDDNDAIFKWENIEYVGFSISRGGFTINCESFNSRGKFGEDTIYHSIRIDDIKVLEMSNDDLDYYIASIINLELVSLLSNGTTKLC